MKWLRAILESTWCKTMIRCIQISQSIDRIQWVLRKNQKLQIKTIESSFLKTDQYHLSANQRHIQTHKIPTNQIWRIRMSNHRPAFSRDCIKLQAQVGYHTTDLKCSWTLSRPRSMPSFRKRRVKLYLMLFMPIIQKWTIICTIIWKINWWKWEIAPAQLRNQNRSLRNQSRIIWYHL